MTAHRARVMAYVVCAAVLALPVAAGAQGYEGLIPDQAPVESVFAPAAPAAGVVLRRPDLALPGLYDDDYIARHEEIKEAKRTAFDTYLKDSRAAALKQRLREDHDRATQEVQRLEKMLAQPTRYTGRREAFDALPSDSAAGGAGADGGAVLAPAGLDAMMQSLQ